MILSCSSKCLIMSHSRNISFFWLSTYTWQTISLCHHTDKKWKVCWSALFAIDFHAFSQSEVVLQDTSSAESAENERQIVPAVEVSIILFMVFVKVSCVPIISHYRSICWNKYSRWLHNSNLKAPMFLRCIWLFYNNEDGRYWGPWKRLSS